MSNFICGGIQFLLAFAAYLQASKAKKAGNKGQSTALMVVSVLFGVGAVVNLLAAMFGG